MDRIPGGGGAPTALFTDHQERKDLQKGYVIMQLADGSRMQWLEPLSEPLSAILYT